ncbi:phospholipid methyltransferase [Rhodanobacter hydrolyticus]|uniref:Phospholipid methyltransferase n=3 Tax=Rhodanobacter TaxID=75309 RepID=A0ABW8JD58_9GAMM|nr:phospholipid methyltransferase [Rhodanobacter sp. 7MK24]
MSLNDTMHFLRAWMRDPRSVGALAPSGPALARLMTAHVDHAHGPVIELGPGTGVFTRALLERGLPGHRLVLVETDPVLASTLEQRYPHARVLRMDAAQLGRSSSLFGDERASAVISGLPLLSIPSDKVAAIVEGVFERQLQSGGALYQFTYGLRCPVPRALRQRLGLQAERVGGAWLNLPPAWVWRIRRVG